MALLGKTEIVQRINRYTTKRYSLKISESVFEDWIQEELLPKAEAKGRSKEANQNWSYTCSDYKRALKICSLKHQGYKRFNAITIELWFRNHALPFDRVHSAIMHEYEKFRKKLLRQITSEYDPRGNEPPTQKRINSIIYQMGKPAAELAHIGESFSDELKISAIQSAKFNQTNIGQENLLLQFFSNLLSDPEEVENSISKKLERTPQEDFETAKSNLDFTCKTRDLI